MNVGSPLKVAKRRVFLREHRVVTKWDGQSRHDTQAYEKKYNNSSQGKESGAGESPRPKRERSAHLPLFELVERVLGAIACSRQLSHKGRPQDGPCSHLARSIFDEHDLSKRAG